jgi:hypothetical protein
MTPQIKRCAEVLRIIASLVLLLVGCWSGYFTGQHIWRCNLPFYNQGYSFGLIFDFQIIHLYEPWSSCFAVLCAGCFIVAGYSLIVLRPYRYWFTFASALCGSLIVFAFWNELQHAKYMF